MKFDLTDAITILDRTPEVLDTWLRDLPGQWTGTNEGGETWSPFDVLGHLVHGERTDWIARLEIILSEGESRPFDPFDRFAQFEESEGKTMNDLLDEFARLRAANLSHLVGKNLGPRDFDRRGTHPELGTVTLGNLLSAWVTHDLGHVQQIARVMAKQYKVEVGVWADYMPVLQR